MPCGSDAIHYQEQKILFIMKATSASLRVIFLGTPAFAVSSLEQIIQSRHQVAAVVTTPDKPAGRGRRPLPSEVKVYAKEKGLKILQPDNLTDPAFIATLKQLQPDIMVVVAFRMLPEVVWSLPPLGTINLHASLLPQYRGAAPIQRAVMNGEITTGLTTFFIDHRIDTGRILLQSSLDIGKEETSGELHDRMKNSGARLVSETLDLIASGQAQPRPQVISSGMVLKNAPKITREECVIDWRKPAMEIHNMIRGLSPSPAASTTLLHPEGDRITLKVFRSSLTCLPSKDIQPSLLTDSKTFLRIALADGILSLTEVQLKDRKRMPVGDFLRGFHLTEEWKPVSAGQ